MASDVTLELLDREAPVILHCDQHTTMDQLLVTTAATCHISPVARGLFAFKQAGKWVPPSQMVGVGPAMGGGGGVSPLQLRLRYKMPDWKARERPSNLMNVDPKAFQYFYYQVRRDFDSGLVCNKKVAGEKDQKWWVPIIQPGTKDKREDRLIELNVNMLELVGRNMAIDVIDEVIDKKEVVKNVKAYIPKDLYSGLVEKIMAVKMLQANVEGYVDKLLKAYQPTMSSMQLKDDFLKLTEKFFPAYFCESFSAQYDEGGRVCEVRLLVSPPEEDKQVTLTMIKRGDVDKSTVVATIDQICNIAIQDPTSVEISRKNGVPLYFRLLSAGDATSFLALLCGFYRLAEKWTFSLCTELKFPILEQLNASKVHGPVTKAFAEEKLKKTNFKKGSFLVRQSATDHHKLFLHFCSRDACRPEEVPILEERGMFRLQGDIIPCIPVQLRDQFRTVGELILALRTVPSRIELGNCVHPSEFDRTMSLLLCRTDTQWREDSLGSKMIRGHEKVVIQPRSLARYENTLAKGRMCSVWQGVWHRSPQETRTVAIKQLHKSLVTSHLSQFLNLSQRALMWDDGSLASVAGFCLPCADEPPVLVTEYFELGPLPNYLANNRSLLQPVDLLEAATCLARALYYLEDSRMVHGEIRARNIFVAQHSETQFKVKLCEGGLEGPSREDVHWLDFQQLQAVLANEVTAGPVQPVQPTLPGDVWSFGTTLWEIFSLGQTPLPGVSWQEAARQYVAGYRLPWPGAQQLATPLYNIINDCWQPVQGQRKQPQAIMRDINQLLYKVFNSRRIHEYVTIDAGPPSPSTPATLTPSHSVTASSRSSLSMDLASPPMNTGLVPMFTDISRKLLENHTFSEFGSSSPLITGSGGSRSGSSLTGSLFNTDMSAITCQTSLDWGSGGGGGLYSISSIYQLDDSQIEYTTDFPLGEGNFGVVYKGVRTRSDGDWEQVAIKMIKDTDTMTNSAYDDMEREVSLMKKLSHENIVKIKGVLIDGPNTVIVMEFIREGSLDRYLQVNRHNLDYPKQLFGYSQNIVDGMEYLTHNKIIHRDLAARNILVADQETVKISDFGLARVATNDSYVMHSTTNIPVRWEAIECLVHRKYSHKSDVWSFGVTLWEMFAFGATPALSGCEDFFTSSATRQRQDFRDWLTKLEEGVRLPQTELCPNFLYSRVMLACWHKDPQARPTFLQLKHTIKKAELEVT
eukprot:GFUD01041549.1.p1 GENE.GFUD01041549.1~~GFUD01041549.1.p1  ORF type:complete len:1200 (+),score=378.78 GFUD01041549.1:57-3656(+)